MVYCPSDNFVQHESIYDSRRIILAAGLRHLFRCQGSALLSAGNNHAVKEQ